MERRLTLIFGFCLLSTLVGCSSGGLTTREKGAGIGALSGAAVGGIIGAAVGRPGAGAAIGGALGLGSGALVGDQLQGQEQNNRSSSAKSMPTKQSYSGKDRTWKSSKKPVNTNLESADQDSIDRERLR